MDAQEMNRSAADMTADLYISHELITGRAVVALAYFGFGSIPRVLEHADHGLWSAG
jgi:hypothetical protein